MFRIALYLFTPRGNLRVSSMFWEVGGNLRTLRKWHMSSQQAKLRWTRDIREPNLSKILFKKLLNNSTQDVQAAKFSIMSSFHQIFLTCTARTVWGKKKVCQKSLIYRVYFCCASVKKRFCFLICSLGQHNKGKGCPGHGLPIGVPKRIGISDSWTVMDIFLIPTGKRTHPAGVHLYSCKCREHYMHNVYSCCFNVIYVSRLITEHWICLCVQMTKKEHLITMCFSLLAYAFFLNSSLALFLFRALLVWCEATMDTHKCVKLISSVFSGTCNANYALALNLSTHMSNWIRVCIFRILPLGDEILFYIWQKRFNWSSSEEFKTVSDSRGPTNPEHG